MENAANMSKDELIVNKIQDLCTVPVIQDKKDPGGMFTCAFCSLHEHFDYKGVKPPFARQLIYTEPCYVMKDPFSLPNKGELLVLGSDCSMCNISICLRCSIFYKKRFCQNCALNNIHYFPSQIQMKIRNLIKKTDA